MKNTEKANETRKVFASSTRVIGFRVSTEIVTTGEELRKAILLFVNKFKELAENKALIKYIDDEFINAAGILESVVSTPTKSGEFK